MYALPTLIRSANGDFSFHDGIIVSLPNELKDHYRIQQYAKIDSLGWGISEFKYSYYATSLPFGAVAINPGLIITDKTNPSKKFYGYKSQLTANQVESLALGANEILSQMVALAQSDLRIMVHDLRALSAAIYNPAKEAQQLIRLGNHAEAIKRLETVLAAQGILRLRTDALDFAGNPIAPEIENQIVMFKKIDKVQRCFKSLALSQDKSVFLHGSSFRRIKGPDIFELAPYTIIDNAIKYSPRGSEIFVSVEDTPRSTVMQVRSYGPRISDDEKVEIFSQYKRGRAAKATITPGTGVGLNMARRIVEDFFKGSIQVEQKIESMVVDTSRYYETNFIVDIPSH